MSERHSSVKEVLDECTAADTRRVERLSLSNIKILDK